MSANQNAPAIRLAASLASRADQIVYRGGYRYQTKAKYFTKVSIFPPAPVFNDFVQLHPDGSLIISSGYAWDGPSGPTVHTSNFMRASLVHDALYQLMREKLLPQQARLQADIELRRICREDGMSRFRSTYVFWAVRLFGASAAEAGKLDGLLVAPRP